jgi:hypothetical protein
MMIFSASIWKSLDIASREAKEEYAEIFGRV